MDVHPTKNVSIGIDPYPSGFALSLHHGETSLDFSMHRRLPCNCGTQHRCWRVYRTPVKIPLHKPFGPDVSWYSAYYAGDSKWCDHLSRQHQLFRLAGDTCSLRVLVASWDPYGYRATQMMGKEWEKPDRYSKTSETWNSQTPSD